MLLHHLWELPLDSLMALWGALEVAAQGRFERLLRDDRARLAGIARDYELGKTWTDQRGRMYNAVPWPGYLPPIPPAPEPFKLAPGQTYDWRMRHKEDR